MKMKQAKKQFEFRTVWTTTTQKTDAYTVTTKKYRTQMVKKGESK